MNCYLLWVLAFIIEYFTLFVCRFLYHAKKLIETHDRLWKCANRCYPFQKHFDLVKSWAQLEWDNWNRRTQKCQSLLAECHFIANGLSSIAYLLVQKFLSFAQYFHLIKSENWLLICRGYFSIACFVVTVCFRRVSICFLCFLYMWIKSSLSSNPRPYRLLVAIKRMAKNLVNTILMTLLMDWVSSLGNCRWAKFVKMD